MTDLYEAVVVVTGGAAGIGRALAQEAARRGAKIMIADVRDASETVAQLQSDGIEAASTIADVAKIDEVQRLLRETVDQFGQVNVVCSNVGASVAGRLQDVDPTAARHAFRVNIEGTFNLVHTFAPALIESAAAHRPAYLMLTGSEHSLAVPPHVAPISVYTSSKYAILGLAMTAHRDLSPGGVGVSMLAPGWTLTAKVKAMIAADPAADAAITQYAQEPAEVARLGFDGLLAGTRVIATNPHTRDFAIEHARALIADIERLPAPGDPEQAGAPH